MLSRLRTDHGRFLLLAGLLTLAALVVRVADLGAIPPGLHHDEAWNGIDASTISASYHPIFFPNSNGREPLFLYMQALSLLLLGHNVVALRIVSALVGTLTVPLAILLGRVLTGSR